MTAKFLAAATSFGGGASTVSAERAQGSALRPGHRPIRLLSGEFLPTGELSANLARAQTQAAGAKFVHVILQFDQLPDAARRAQLAATGVRLLDYLPENAFFAAVPVATQSKQLEAAGVRWLGDIATSDKMPPRLRLTGVGRWALRANNTTADLRVHYFVDVAPKTAAQELEALGAKVLEQVEELHRLTVNIPVGLLDKLAGADFVRWVEEVPPPPVEFNDMSRASTQAELVQAAPYSLDGAGVALGEWDGGHVDDTHDDFAGRVTFGDSSSVGDHATHVAGTMAGDGTLSAANGGTPRQWRGMSSAASIISYLWDNNITDHNAAINSYGIVLSQNSWGFVVDSGNCSLYGDYGSDAPEYDRVITGLYGGRISVVFAAGNERDDGDCHLTNGAPSYVNYKCVGPPGTAKNMISVGALNADNTTISTFSSWGPVDDGRLKPEIVAPGCPVKSTLPGDTYAGGWCGTSMAAPAVSGCIGLLVQDYRVHFGGLNPLPSTVRALLLHTASDLDDATSWFNKGPDYASGYGRVQIKNAVDQLRTNGFLVGEVNHTQTNSYTLTVPPGSTQVKVTLAWDDPAGAENAALALVNDLDLIVLDPDGVRHYPWTLDPNNPAAEAVRAGEDHTNVLEQVFVEIASGADDAADGAYNDGWQSADNGGAGFGAWLLNPATSGDYAGFFVGDSNLNGGGSGPGINSAGNKALGMYANNTNLAEAVRIFGGGGLLDGQSFAVDMDNGWLDGTNTTAGFALQDSGGVNRFELYFRAGDADYTVNDASGPHSTGIGWTEGGLHIAFTVTDADTYSVTLTRFSDNATATLTGTLTGNPGQRVSRLRLFCYNTNGGGSQRDVFFNNLSLTGTPLVTGDWTVQVAGYNVPTAPPQKYTLVFSPPGIAVPPNLNLNSATFDDSAGGNDNSVIEPGETIHETIVLGNTGGGVASNVTGSLTTTNAGVTITQPNSVYPDITTGATGTNATLFAYRLAKTVPCGSILSFNHITTSSGGLVLTSTFSRTVGQLQTSGAITNTFDSSDVPKAILDIATIYSTNTVSIAGTYVIGDVDVSVRLDHTWDSDLEIAIEHPDGTEVVLSSRHGGSGDNYGENACGAGETRTVFDDEAGTPIASGTAPFLGSFKPDGVLSNLNGKTANGIWRLRVSDRAGADVGTLDCWGLRIISVEQQYVCDVFNNPPVASNQNVEVAGDVAHVLTLTGSDADDDPLTFATNSLPAHGLLSAFDSATGAITYTPAHGYSGADTFTFTVNDGTVNSPTGTISIVVQALTDDDLDGMPDAWETEHGVSDPNDDPDGDGFTNAQEYAANTDPQSPASALRITGIAQDSSGQTTIVWDSVAGVRYRVQYSDGDASGNFDGVFTDILRPPVVEIATGSSTSFTDDFTLTSGPPTTGQRYFRVKVAP